MTHFRNYDANSRFTPDFFRVHDFLRRIDRERVVDENWLWGRWEWMVSHPMLDVSKLTRIGLWEEDGVLVAVATYESAPGHVWLLVDPARADLREEMLRYAEGSLSQDGVLRVLIDDEDAGLQELAAGRGFSATQEREPSARLPIREETVRYRLPEGFRIVSLQDEFDLRKYDSVMWRGFNHEGEPPETAETRVSRRREQSGPHADMSLKVAVAAPDGRFASYCGMWHLPGDDYALVEPVATDPAFRRMGLGRAAVLEGARRCGLRGAKVAYVGSSQAFYFSIGFRPCDNRTWWEKRIG